MLCLCHSAYSGSSLVADLAWLLMSMSIRHDQHSLVFDLS